MSEASFRTASRNALAQALLASRRDTLATWRAYTAALPGLQVPMRAELNPPRWELGHVDWFQQHWIARNPERHHGVAADPLAPRSPAAWPDADALFDSSRVPHDSRWQLPLPEPEALMDLLEAGLARTLQHLAEADEDDTGLYFHRLVLAHEDMHHEAALYMAQSLGVDVHEARWQQRPLSEACTDLALPASQARVGHDGPGFAFDNELAAQTVALPAFAIASRVHTWAEFLPFVEAGGYERSAGWSAEGLAWRQAQGLQAPRHLRRQGSGWQRRVGSLWLDLDPTLPASHLSAFEAEAWCAWAGRRLPTEAEWEHAARTAGPAFAWGAVWEWTANAFEPYPGFVPHPYTDYSQPWFGSRRVLRGASAFTQPRLHDVRYRNFFPPGRNDILAGFRSGPR